MTGATRRTLDAILDAILDAFPAQGRDLGLRAYQGRVDDLCPDGLRRHLEQVPDALDGLAAGLEEVPLAFQEAAAEVLCGYASFYRTEVAALAGPEVAERAAAAVERYRGAVAAMDGPPLEPWGA